MHSIAFVLACAAFAALTVRTKNVREQIRDRSSAKHQESKNVGNTTRSLHSSAVLGHSQAHARLGAPNALKWLALLFLAGNSPTDAIALPKSGFGQLASGVSRPQSAHGLDNSPKDPSDRGTLRAFMGLQSWESVSGDDSVPKNSQAQKSEPAKLTRLPKKDWLEPAEKLHLSSSVSNPTLKDMLVHLHKPPSRFHRRSQVLSGAVIQRPKLELELERAPPAPPPPNSGKGDGGGGGDDEMFYLTGLSKSQAVELINDWIARTRIFCMDDQFCKLDEGCVVEVHRKSLESLEVLRSHVENLQEPEGMTDLKEALLAMETPDKTTVLAFVTGSFGWQQQEKRGALKVYAMSLSPVELNQESEDVAWRMKQLKQGLRSLVDRFEIDLILPENSDGE